MPLTSAIQSAMAIRHERERREQRRLSKIPRDPGGRNSMEGDEVLNAPKDKTDSSLTTFHMGVVFILLGFMMIFSSMIPLSILDADWSRMLGVGVSFIFIGLLMVMVNRIITAREEEELSRYVKQRLSRTRSGHPFVRDHEQDQPPSTPLPSALKKSGGPCPSPRSPKDKVTFAEFKNEIFDCEEEGGVGPRKGSRDSSGGQHHNGRISAGGGGGQHLSDLMGLQPNGGGGRKPSLEARLSNGQPQHNQLIPAEHAIVPPSANKTKIPQINICEPSSESGKESSTSSNTVGDNRLASETVGAQDPSSEATLGDRDVSSEPEETDKDFKGTLDSVMSYIVEPPSPTNETQRLLPDLQDFAVKRKIY